MISYRVEFDGVRVGPVFLNEDRPGGDDQAAHDWVALYYPNWAYTIVTLELGAADIRDHYPSADNRPWA